MTDFIAYAAAAAGPRRAEPHDARRERGTRRISPALLTAALGALLVACGPAVEVGPNGSSGSSGQVGTSSNDKTYVLDFTDSPVGGLWLGLFDDVAFTLDFDAPTRKYAFTSGGNEPTGPGLVSLYDLGGGCQEGNYATSPHGLEALGDGQAGTVARVDVEMLPRTDAEKTPAWTGGMCFGYRTLDGGWHWRVDPVLLKYDPGSDRIHGRVPVEEGPVDAIKLIFESTKQVTPRITYTGHPESAE